MSIDLFLCVGLFMNPDKVYVCLLSFVVLFWVLVKINQSKEYFFKIRT
jgi:hypothetical protein